MSRPSGKSQLTSSLALRNLLRREPIHCTELRRDVIRPPQKREIIEDAASYYANHSSDGHIITSLEFLPPDFTHRESYGHEYYCKAREQPHDHEGYVDIRTQRHNRSALTTKERERKGGKGKVRKEIDSSRYYYYREICGQPRAKLRKWRGLTE
jgi:hypothetical protein